MSGHSKWSTIKRKKAANDAKRGKAFTRLLREIQVAAKLGGANPEGNPRLKSAIASAKALSVPGDNIERAIKRGSGEVEGANYEEITYEGYGPGGVAVLVKSMTENKNRTVAEVRHAFTKCNGNLASTNSVGYLFSEKGICTIDKSLVAEDELLDKVLDAGADDVVDMGEFWEIVSEPGGFDSVRDAVATFEQEFEAELRMVPGTTVDVKGKDAQNVLKLMEILDDLDDVQSVVSNFDIDESELAELSK